MPLTISDDDFRRLTSFIQAHYGINLTEKRQLVSSRLSSVVSEQGYSSFTPFITKLLEEKNPNQLELVLNRLTTNYTFFMREQEHFEFFEKTILPDLVRRHQRDKVLAIWSAGCSSGEEPYNISICIKEFLGAQAKLWDTRVLATDISQQAMAKAKRGIYDLPDTIPDHWRKRYFNKVAGSDGKYQVAPEIRNNVIFQTFNLMDPIKFRLKFDVIFCRNVMIYFDQPTKDALVRRFYDATVPGGYFLISHSENLSKNAPYRTIAPSTFQK
ncbi:MAG: protein-glutamate O-methyltransferase CheR [Oscillospiraceae bacterium]|nr:protein-glutamate O-methyltransferase CheR [Oscillospiraceae bacterium]MCI9587689.1 protein-glutamate O-methyltransferase CheR [Oscillospiraceae bacterium]